MLKKHSAYLVLGLVFLAVLAYANSMTGKFVWDDTLLILDNKHIKDLQHIGDIFREDLFHMSDLPTGYYRPVQAVSYVIDYALWGNEPFGYHLTNLVLQIINSIMVLYLCLLIFCDRLKSFFVAAVFCVHPAFVPIVGYIAGRADLFGLLFSLLLIYYTIRYVIRGRGLCALWLSLFFYGLAILSKEYYILAPLFPVLYIMLVKGDPKALQRVKITLLVLGCEAVVYIVLRATILNFHQSMGVIAEQPFLTRLAIFPWILKNYMMMLLAPVGLSMEKKLVYGSLVEPRFVIAYIAPAILAWLFYRLRKTGQVIQLFWVSWFAVGIIPMCNLLMPLKAIWADHWSYMASIGFFSFLASLPDCAGGRIKEWRNYKKTVIAAAVFFIAFLIMITIRENSYWQNEEILYARILETSPHSARTIYNQGKVYEEKGELENALESYNKAIASTSGDKAQYFNSRGMLYKNLGNKEKALSDFESAARIGPSVALYHNNLGCIYAELNRVEDARREWMRALEINPDDEFAAKNLGLIGEKK